METLKKLYEEEIVPNLTKKFNYTTKMQVPKIEKIVLNMGVGDAVNDQKFLDAAVRDLEAIAGQKPVITTAKKSIAGFKLREGNKIGCKVTLRGDNMYNFLNKLITIALPRVRDFRGISPKAFDGKGNYTLGIKDQLIFPEIVFDDVWDRGYIEFHSSFSDARKGFLGLNDEFYSKPSLLFKSPYDGPTFYISFYVNDGKTSIIPRYCRFIIQLCFILNYKKAIIMENNIWKNQVPPNMAPSPQEGYAQNEVP